MDTDCRVSKLDEANQRKRDKCAEVGYECVGRNAFSLAHPARKQVLDWLELDVGLTQDLLDKDEQRELLSKIWLFNVKTKEELLDLYENERGKFTGERSNTLMRIRMPSISHCHAHCQIFSNTSVPQSRARSGHHSKS